jgi:hypothetical protein
LKKTCCLFLLIIALTLSSCGFATLPVIKGQDTFSDERVAITNEGDYFRVELDFSGGANHRQIAENYSEGILKVVPDFEMLVDSYLEEIFSNEDIYNEMLRRTDDLKLQLPQQFKDEIEGMASNFSGGTESVRGDEKISVDEFYMYNLFPDILRATQCSFVSVFGAKTSDGNTISGRNLDWFGGSHMEISRFPAVIFMKNDSNKICSIGFLGFMGILSGFNDQKVFAAILDSATGTAYTAQGRRSYAFDLRLALENEDTLTGVSDYMKDPAKLYTFNHIIALSDQKESKVLENNFSGSGPNDERVKRELRGDDSPLNNGISWGISDAVGSVNSFLLKGNYDNHTDNKYNTKRWKNMKKQLRSKGETVTVDELKDVISYGKGSPGTFNDSGHLYNRLTNQSIIFQPATLSLEIFFHPKDKMWADIPTYQKIQVKW